MAYFFRKGVLLDTYTSSPVSHVGESFATGPLSQSFTTSATTTNFQSAEFFFFGAVGASIDAVKVSILHDNAGAPGTLLAVLGLLDQNPRGSRFLAGPGGDGVSTGIGVAAPAPAGSGPALAANTRYWLQLNGAGNANVSWGASLVRMGKRLRVLGG